MSTLCFASQSCTQGLAEMYKSECEASGRGDNSQHHFPAARALALLDAHGKGIKDDRDRAAFWTTVADLSKVLLQVRYV